VNGTEFIGDASRGEFFDEAVKMLLESRPGTIMLIVMANYQRVQDHARPCLLDRLRIAGRSFDYKDAGNGPDIALRDGGEQMIRIRTGQHPYRFAGMQVDALCADDMATWAAVEAARARLIRSERRKAG